MTVLDRVEVILELNRREYERNLGAAERQMLQAERRMNRAILGISAAFGAAGVAVGVAAARAAIDMEKLERGLQVTAGGAEAAAGQMKDLERIARLPGLGFREVIAGANQLNVAFGDMPDTLGRSSRTLEAFGRAVALTGGGPAELQRVITQVTQIASAGKLLQQDLRPIIQTAPAVGQALKDAFGTISPQEIEALGLSTEQFLDQLTGALFDLPEPVDTVSNRLENLEDAAFRAGAALGDIFLPAIGTGATFLADALERAADALDDMDTRTGGMTAESIAFMEMGAVPQDPFRTGGRQAGGATQFLPGRAARDTGAAQRHAAMQETTRLLREQGKEFAAAAFEAEQLDHSIDLLNQRAASFNFETLEGLDLLGAYGLRISEVKPDVLALETATGALNIKLDEETIAANQAAVAFLALSNAQQQAAMSASDIGSVLGIAGGLGGALSAFGLAIPGLGTALGAGSSLLSAFTSAIPFLADGGTLAPGEVGIVGERGPEMIVGPAEVVPMTGDGAGGGNVTFTFPPPASPTDAARDPVIAQMFVAVLDELRANGYAPA